MAFNLRKLPNVTTRSVWCTVTPRTVGHTILRAYDYDGLEKPPREKRCYRVPLYQLVLRGDGNDKEFVFKVVRFGVVVGRRGDYVFGVRPKHYQLIWQDKYMGGRGGWKLVSTKALIHDGANRPRRTSWGAAGCIEVTGTVEGRDAWRVFNQRVRELSGVPSDWDRLEAHKLIQKNSSFSCVIQAVSKPPLVPVKCP